mmetsp:Transcript_4807/g.13453  ORF Transcript_4807/g.13453 Transcript_4807/m.13453 type:complete len:237 (+) Transcript_4807:91-801(+)
MSSHAGLHLFHVGIQGGNGGRLDRTTGRGGTRTPVLTKLCRGNGQRSHGSAIVFKLGWGGAKSSQRLVCQRIQQPGSRKGIRRNGGCRGGSSWWRRSGRGGRWRSYCFFLTRHGFDHGWWRSRRCTKDINFGRSGRCWCGRGRSIPTGHVQQIHSGGRCCDGWSSSHRWCCRGCSWARRRSGTFGNKGRSGVGSTNNVAVGINSAKERCCHAFFFQLLFRLFRRRRRRCRSRAIGR